MEIRAPCTIVAQAGGKPRLNLVPLNAFCQGIQIIFLVSSFVLLHGISFAYSQLLNRYQK
jgi:hypothetical protein